MLKENGMVMMTEAELKEYEEAKEQLLSVKKVASELSEVLLTITRDSDPKTDEIQVSMKTFLHLYNRCFDVDEDGNDKMETDLYNHDVCVSWHGFRCNCFDGAAACNYIIEGIESVMEEYEE